MIPLHRPFYDHREQEAVLRVLGSRLLAGNGREGAALERELREAVGARYVLAVSSASHALEMAMDLLGVRGGEVLLPSFTFPSAANAVLRAGGRPVFCEVSEPDLNLDLEDAARRAGPRTRAVVVTHYAGHPVAADGLGLPIVEDAAHALGSCLGGRSCGTLGELGCFSFHQTKNLAAGEGGALVCRSPGLAGEAHILREKGTDRDAFLAGEVPFYTWQALGSSYVLPELAAALARVQLGKLPEITEARRLRALRYDDALAELEARGALVPVRPRPGTTSSWHIYAVLVDPLRRPRVLARLRAAGVEAASHFEPLHASPFGRRLEGAGALPRSERLAASVVRLPLYPDLTEAEQGRVVDALRRALL